MSSERLLTKSRFKIARECPTKLFYTSKREYPSTKDNDNFLQALAEGGFQVGALAKEYFPEGADNDISLIGYEESVEKTNALLKQDKVTIFEGAFRFGNLFIRADIVVKDGNNLRLIEVKSKSFPGSDGLGFFNNKGDRINSDFKEYLEDIAFQKYVVTKAYPDLKVSTSLMLADKRTEASLDGLNQIFKLVRDGKRKSVEVDKAILNKSGFGNRILTIQDADDAIDHLFKYEVDTEGRSFIDQIHYLADAYEKDQKILPQIGSICKKCEFRSTSQQMKEGLHDGYKECWKQILNWKDENFDIPLVYNIWNYRGTEKKFSESRYFIHELNEADFDEKPPKTPGLSSKQRQWMQVEKIKNNDSTPYLDISGLKTEFATWEYPLHFIDFETSAVAIPYYKGMRPYEGIAFQFSHHVVSSDGTIAHRGEFLNVNVGEFPNFDFIRNLKKELQEDNGTIFRYSYHENTYLNYIYNQLGKSQEKDKDELMNWIKTITYSSGSQAEEWVGERSMVDLCEIVKKYYYNPLTNGSNSLKYVLPATLNSSSFLQDKYSQAIYGVKDGITSLNFANHKWIEFDTDGKVKDPYSLLPPIFDDAKFEEEVLEFIEAYNLEELKDGGAAMMAYNIIQFTSKLPIAQESIKSALLKYCELDTMAMVFIWEYFHSELHKN